MYKEWLIKIPALTGKEKRKAYVYVPDAAAVDDSRRYPVLYMFDGQNLFRDADASYGKSWGNVGKNKKDRPGRSFLFGFLLTPRG